MSNADRRSVRTLPSALSCAVLTSFGCALAAQAEAGELPRYSVIIERIGVPRAEVTLTIPQSHPGMPSVLVSRAVPLNIKSQMSDVRCAGVAMEEDAGRWQLPMGCREATWKVTFARPGPEGILGSEQQSIAMPGGWFLFSEPSSLLRLISEPPEGSVIAFSGLTVRSKDIRLRSRSLAPSFFVLGDAPSLSVQDGALKLTYFADDLSAVQKLVEPSKHLKGLAYYRRVMGPNIVRHVDELKVVWIQIANDRGAFGGAAGHDTFLVNYAVDPRSEDTLKPLITALHEQFHQIDGGKNRPQWVSESLAQYYALKAALHLSGGDPSYVAVWNRWFEKAEKAKGQLLDAQRRVRSKDFSAYGLFYSRGTMFWRDVEAALKRAGQQEGLDPVLPVILGATFGPGASLPEEVLQALSAIPGPELNALFERYL